MKNKKNIIKIVEQNSQKDLKEKNSEELLPKFFIKISVKQGNAY